MYPFSLSQEFQRLLEKARHSLAHYYRLKKPPSYWSHTGLDINELSKGFEDKREGKEDFYDLGRKSAPEVDLLFKILFSSFSSSHGFN